MADKAGAEDHDSHVDSIKEKITETFEDSSSSSDSDHDKAKTKKDFPIKKKVNHNLSWKEKPVHDLLGGGKRMQYYLALLLILYLDLQIFNIQFLFPTFY